MDLAPTLFSTSWSSGVNAYATVALLNVLGRVGWGDVPEELQGNVILAVAVVMYVVEFVADKVPFFDSIWDVINLPVRTAVAGRDRRRLRVGLTTSQSAEQAFAAGGSSATALASAGVKSLLRLGINTSPEPGSNIIVSLLEDGLVGVVVFIASSIPCSRRSSPPSCSSPGSPWWSSSPSGSAAPTTRCAATTGAARLRAQPT